MHRHESRLRVQREVEHIDVAKSDQGLRVGSNRLVVDEIEIAQGRPAAG